MNYTSDICITPQQKLGIFFMNKISKLPLGYWTQYQIKTYKNMFKYIKHNDILARPVLMYLTSLSREE